MKRNVIKWIAMCLMLVMIVGCQTKEKEQEEPNQSIGEKVITEEEIDTVAAEEEEVSSEENVVDIAKAPIPIKGINQTVYENEHGSITFLGYDLYGYGNYVLAFSFKGEMADATNTAMAITAIREDGERETLTTENRIEVRKVSDDERHHLYQTEMSTEDLKLVRLDILPEDPKESSKKVEPIVLQWEDTEDTVELSSYASVAKRSEGEVNITRETPYASLQVDKVVYSDELQSIQLVGGITYKEDVEWIDEFSYAIPSTNQSGTDYLRDDWGSIRYAGTTIPIDREIPLNEPLAEDDARVYFAVDGVFLAYDVAKGEVLNEVDVTHFPMRDSHYVEHTQSIYGYPDVNGVPQYDGLYTLEHFHDYGYDTPGLTDYRFITGSGYDTLTFEVGPVENDSLHEDGYLIQVLEYGFKSDDKGNLLEEPLHTEVIKKDDEMKKVTVDTKGATSIVVRINFNRPLGEEDWADGWDYHIPILIKDVTISE